MKLAVEEDITPFTSSMTGMDAVSSRFGSYVGARNDANKPLNNVEMSLQCMTHCSSTNQEALDNLPNIRWKIRAQKALTEMQVVDRRAQAHPYQGETELDIFLDRTYLGDPDSLIQKFQRANEVGITDISLWMDWGGIGHEKLVKSMRLLGEEVIPDVRSLTPPDSAVQEALEAKSIEGSFTITGDRLSDGDH